MTTDTRVSVEAPEVIDEDGEIFETGPEESRPQDPFGNPTGKECTHCGDYKPLSHFWRHTKSPDGLHYWCRDCFPKVVGEAKRLRQDLLEQGFKTCGSCDKTKTVASFGAHQRNPDGLRSTCRECEAGQRRARRAPRPTPEAGSAA